MTHMHRLLMLAVLWIALEGDVIAYAQNSTRLQTQSSAQTDVAANLFGTFSGASANFDKGQAQQSQADAAGGMLEFRHLHSPLVGFEATYSLNRANQSIAFPVFFPGGGAGGVESISAFAHEITGDWIVSTTEKSVRLFALAGAGLLLTEPAGGLSYSQGSSTAVYVYGVGGDWQLLPRFGLRLQYRGNIHKVPSVATAFKSQSFGGVAPPFSSPNSFIHTAEPMVGVYYRF